MNRKIALFFLSLATFMLATYVILPHHHHCHEVVFLKACNLAGPHFPDECGDVSTHQGTTGHNCCPVPASEADPCWKNILFLSDEQEDIVASPLSDFFFSICGIPSRTESLFTLTASIQKIFTVFHEKPHQDPFPMGLVGFRAPPFC
ncbi:MAG: hypothetical protein K2O66_04915 [Bacteroidales bacterium]|nr:hypothetical protein [Bacteroidales bacterium]MDE7072684.1 hypothetical protein [Bacteroidales bacterium]